MVQIGEGSIGLRERIRSGTPVLGTWNTLASPLVTEVLAVSGLDFQVIDLEHGPFVMDEVHLHVSACSGYGGCAPLVRIPANEPWMALQALDQGAEGIVVPHIDGVSGAARFAESIRYHPDGGRGFTPFSKAGNFGTREVSAHVGASNNEVVGVEFVSTPPVSYLAPEPLFGPTQFESAITRQHVGTREGNAETVPAPRCFFRIHYQHLRRCLLLEFLALLNSGAAGKACENSRGAGRRCGKQETWQ